MLPAGLRRATFFRFTATIRTRARLSIPWLFLLSGKAWSRLTPYTTTISVAICYPTGMSQPVKLSDSLVLDARLAGDAMERSIAGQVEFWARLGRSVEVLLEGRQVRS